MVIYTKNAQICGGSCSGTELPKPFIMQAHLGIKLKHPGHRYRQAQLILFENMIHGPQTIQVSGSVGTQKTNGIGKATGGAKAVVLTTLQVALSAGIAERQSETKKLALWTSVIRMIAPAVSHKEHNTQIANKRLHKHMDNMETIEAHAECHACSFSHPPSLSTTETKTSSLKGLRHLPTF